jgi:hypothetical protein
MSRRTTVTPAILSPVICRQITGDKIAGVTDKNRSSVLPSGDWLGFALDDRHHTGSDREQGAGEQQALSGDHREESGTVRTGSEANANRHNDQWNATTDSD